jgi:two-component system sensor histidine kinase YesM
VKICVKKIKSLSLYVKFVIVIITVGILPLAVLATIILDRMFSEYERSLRDSYEQGLRYASYAIEQLFDGYNDVSKFCYYYSYSSKGDFTSGYANYDNLRQILTGEKYAESEQADQVKKETDTFLQNILKVKASMEMAHFSYHPENGAPVSYHAGNFTNRFDNMTLFSEIIGLENIDINSRNLIIIPTHSFGYVKNSAKTSDYVFTIARNYYDLRGMAGKEKYVGTLFLDFNVSEIADIFTGIDFYSKGSLYVADQRGDCFFSNVPSVIGANISGSQLESALFTITEKYGFGIYLDMKGQLIDEGLLNIRSIIYDVVILTAIALSVASLAFSRGLAKPMYVMMKQMEDIETGRFEGRLPVKSGDEIGLLSARFNKMAEELSNYINQVYVAKIKQTEAELNALKSQIYPHFLYNTLEVIRMTAVSGGDAIVGEMVEALAGQIRYLIGTVSDLVTVQDEISNLEKYIFIVNCRYGNRITFSVDADGFEKRKLPKLILQPIVENAYIHGIRGKVLYGIIQVVVSENNGDLEITVLDNGAGMEQTEAERITGILESGAPGEKTDEGWKSTGLKNVHDRLRYLYGNKYGVTLFSTTNIGTAIKVTLPGNIR